MGMESMFGGTLRGIFWKALLKWVFSGLKGLVMMFVRADMDVKIKAWGREFGESKLDN